MLASEGTDDCTAAGRGEEIEGRNEPEEGDELEAEEHVACEKPIVLGDLLTDGC